jgi:hypothetical protein
MSALLSGGVLDLPVPTAPGAALTDPPLLKMVLSSGPPVLCNWQDSGGWRVELKNGGALYQNGLLTAKGVTEQIYHKGKDPVYNKTVVYTQWVQVGGEANYTATPGTDPVTRSVTVTKNVTTQDSVEISMQFGFEADGFSAGFSAKFGHTVTVSDQTETGTIITFPSSDDLYVDSRVWRSNSIIEIHDLDDQILTWADGDVWAVIKPDYDKGAEFQALISPPRRFIVPNSWTIVSTFFDRKGNVVDKHGNIL